MTKLRPLVLAAALMVACASPPASLAPSSVPLPDGSPTARGTAPPDLPASPSLPGMLHLALDRNPRILAARARAEAAAETPTVEGWLPNPEVMVGWYETSVETRVGSQEWSLGLRQKIPFPTKLATKAELGGVEARRAAVVYERVVRDVLTDVVHAAHELAYLDEALTITREIEALLGRFVTSAAGDGALSNLFRGETQRAQLVSDRVALEDLLEVEREHLRSLLDLPADARIGVPGLPATPPLATSYEDLQAAAEAHSQELVEAGLRLAAAGLQSSLARQRRIPDLSLGVTRIFTDRLDRALGMDPDGNGDDPVIFQAGFTLPIWIHRDEAAIRQARAMERAAALDRQVAARGLRERVARTWYRLRNAERLDRMYREVLLPRATVAVRSAEDLLASGSGNLAETLETTAVLKNFRLAGARARADHGQALADLEAAIGHPLEREKP